MNYDWKLHVAHYASVIEPNYGHNRSTSLIVGCEPEQQNVRLHPASFGILHIFGKIEPLLNKRLFIRHWIQYLIDKIWAKLIT